MGEHVCVIGSGSSAVACAHTLSRSGTQVTILDVGLDIEERSSSLLDRFREDGDTTRLVDEIHRRRAEHRRLTSVQPGKYLFGSDHPYRTIPETQMRSQDGATAMANASRIAAGAVREGRS